MTESGATKDGNNWKLQAIESRREQIAKLRATVDLPAPWETCPDIPCGSIGWRMGLGECVMIDWRDWIKALDREKFMAYSANHKPSESWTAKFIRKIGALRSRITSTPRMYKTWPEWFENVMPKIEAELTTMRWDDYWDFKMKEFEEWIDQR